MNKICEKLDKSKMNVVFVYGTGMPENLLDEIISGIVGDDCPIHCLVLCDMEQVDEYEKQTFAYKMHRKIKKSKRYLKKETIKSGLIHFSPLIQNYNPMMGGYVLENDTKGKKKIVLQEAEGFVKELNISGEEYKGVRTDFYRQRA